MSSTNNCFVYPYNVTASSTDFDDPSYVVDWSCDLFASSWNLPSSMMFDFSDSSIPLINSYRFLPIRASAAPSSFSIEGSVSTDDSWNMILSPSNTDYKSVEWNQFDLVSPHRYPLLRFTIHSSYGDNIELKELQFLVCNRPVSSIEYPETEYSFYKDYEQISISPIQYEYSDCSIQPSLPDGMSIDPNTCIISGVSHSLGSQQYTVTSTMVTPPIQSILNLTFIQCSGSVYKIDQVILDSSGNDQITIRDTSDDSILYQIQPGHSQGSSGFETHYLCITVDRFDVTFTYQAVSIIHYQMYFLLPDGEQEMVLKGKYDANQGNTHIHYVRRPSINHSEQWYYKMGEVPTNWFGDDTSGWSQAARGSFPTSTNRIQLYKKTFNIASLNEVSGLIVSIRYRYGVIVYLNGNEAWRNGVIGDLSTSSTVDNSYTDLKYYVVTLPGKQMQTSTVTTPVTFLQSGSNTIAIAIVAIDDTQLTSYFDAMVRLMPSEQSDSYLCEFTATTDGLSDYLAVELLNVIYAYGCSHNNSITVTLSNNRREWISSVQIQIPYYSGRDGWVTQFVLYGRNSDTDEWTLLKEVTGLTYSIAGQKRRIYFPNNTPYNQFKFENMGTDDPSACWEVQSLDLFADNVLADIPNFTYIRKSFTMSGVNDYQVLNVRVKYSGGVAAYLNGNLVARFNLEDDFDSLSLSITDHDPNVFSKFHVILATSGIEEGNNVFSFEIHRP
ncbi:hypothetical protein WA171_004333, partial [Blastocystis sp. BT1]